MRDAGVEVGELVTMPMGMLRQWLRLAERPGGVQARLGAIQRTVTGGVALYLIFDIDVMPLDPPEGNLPHTAEWRRDVDDRPEKDVPAKIETVTANFDTL